MMRTIPTLILLFLCAWTCLAWTTIGTHSGNTEAVNDVDIEPMEARYVRLNITDAGADHVARIADIEVYGSH